MSQTHRNLARIGQGVTGIALLIFAIGASAVSLTINYHYGLKTGFTAAAIFLLADGGKFALLLALGLRPWQRGTQALLWAVWIACLATSLWAAANSYIDDNAADLFERSHKAARYEGASRDLASTRAELTAIRQQLAGIQTPETSALTGLAAMTKDKIAELRRIRGKGQDEALARARAELADITTKLGEARRRDELTKRRDELEARLAGGKSEVESTRTGGASVPGVAKLAAAMTGHDADRIAQQIGIIKAALFIVLMEALIVLANPGGRLAVDALWPSGGDAEGATCEAKAPVKRTRASAELAAVRAALGESQDLFAERFDVDARTIRRWENGERTPPRTVVLKTKELARERLARPAPRLRGDMLTAVG